MDNITLQGDIINHRRNSCKHVSKNVYYMFMLMVHIVFHYFVHIDCVEHIFDL